MWRKQDKRKIYLSRTYQVIWSDNPTLGLTPKEIDLKNVIYKAARSVINVAWRRGSILKYNFI